MNILLITHWFPPSNTIGAVRPYEIAKFLRDEGHMVHVMTTSGTSVPPTFDVPLDGMEVERLALPSYAQNLMRPSPGVLGIIKKLIIRLFYPDEFMTVARRFAERASSDKKSNIDLVISSAPPFSANVIACRISKELSVPWIADLRDIWADTPYRRSFLISKYVDLLFEKRVLRRASAYMVIGQHMKDELVTRLGSNRQSDVRVMMNGADADPKRQLFDDYECKNPISLVYTGSLYKEKRDLTPLLEAIKSIPTRLDLNFYGAEEAYVEKYAARYPSIPILAHPPVSKKEIKKIQSLSHFLVVALADGDFEKGVLPGKFFEYVECGRPILVIGDKDSEIGQLVDRYRLGCVSRSASELANFIQMVCSKGVWESEVPEALTRKYQLCDVLKPIIESARKDRECELA